MRKSISFKVLSVLSLIVLLFPLFAALDRVLNDPEVPFLAGEEEAEWIQLKRPFNARAWKGDDGATFRKRFVVDSRPSSAVLTVKALRTAKVYIDGVVLLDYNYIEDWKSARSVDLKDYLSAGPHELRIDVLNENGPALLLANSETLRIFTGNDWEASFDGVKWSSVKRADDRGPLEIALKFPSVPKAMYSLSAFYLPLFLLSFFVFLSCSNSAKHSEKDWISPHIFRWILIGAWITLSVNNIMKIPREIGFDAPDHYDYISYIIKNWSLPLATDGWQMFQSPLYYIISAGFQLILSPLFSLERSEMLLRVIPLLCGAAQIEIAYRAVKLVFPERSDLQMMGTAFGGLLPMNIYISQTVGNEPLAGLFSASAIVLVMGLLKSSTGRMPQGRIALVGLMLGLALLTKVTAVLLIPAVALALIFLMVRNDEPLSAIMKILLIVFGIIIAVSGWYYLRNWIELGRPFIGGWDPSRKIVWWQDPGYRTFADLFSFGKSLIYPMYSAIYGFWDSIYSTFWLDGFAGSVAYEFRPEWNYDLLLSGALLSLVPAAGLVTGFFRAVFLKKTSEPVQFFSAYCIALYFSALLYLFFTVPIYSTAKATYTIGLIPCYAVLCVSGLDVFSVNKYAGSAVKALLVCWTINSYFSYFVL